MRYFVFTHKKQANLSIRIKARDYNQAVSNIENTGININHYFNSIENISNKIVYVDSSIMENVKRFLNRNQHETSSDFKLTRNIMYNYMHFDKLNKCFALGVAKEGFEIISFDEFKRILNQNKACFGDL